MLSCSVSFENNCFTFNCHLPQLIDPADDIGRQWTRPNHMKVRSTCPVKSILIRAFLVGFVALCALYHEMVLSAIPTYWRVTGYDLGAVLAFNLGARADYSTLFCNIDNENELQCLVQMQSQSPETRHCYTSHKTVNHSFCGVLHQCHR